MKYVFDFTKVKDKIAVVSLLKDVLQISLSKAKETFDKSKVTLDSTKYPLIDRYLDNFKHADENIIITEFKETNCTINDFKNCKVQSYKPFTLKEENNTQNTPLERAKQVVYCHSNCVLLTKEEYQELCRYKSLYLDLQGSISKIVEEFKEKGQSN